VEALAEAGATVILTSRCVEKAAAVAGLLRANGLKTEGEVVDLARPESVDSAVRSMVSRHGRIDILVNSAATNRLRSVEEMTVAEWNAVMAVNVTGTMLMSRAAAAAMGDCGGVILNLSSIYGMVSPDPGIYGNSGLLSPLVYGVSKAALIQMTRYLAVYWAPRIRVNCITPGGLYAGQDPGFVEAYERRTPLGRMAGPHDLKGAVAFLASDAAQWITGQNLVVDGGWTVW